MRISRILAFILTALLAACAGCGRAEHAEPGHPAASVAASIPASKSAQAGPSSCEASYLARLTPRQKLAQLLTVGVRNAADAAQVVRTEQVGGLFIGSWTDQALLTGRRLDQVKAVATVPLMVTIDEEGGRVSRVANLIGHAPSARVMAATMSVDQVYRLFLQRGRALRAMGITVDFAPDADVSSQPDDTVIGDRSFSADPAVVTRYADAEIRALHDAGLGAVIKHFPGHGAASGDSHKGPVTTPPLAQLQTRDLVPFRNLVGSGAAVMVGHLDVPGLTAPRTPASLSPAAMTLLRTGVGYGATPFDGVIFTDDLGGMAAITSLLSIEDAVATALDAGADDALWTSSAAVGRVLDRLQQEVAAGRLTQARVDQSVLRVARFKGALRC